MIIRIENLSVEYIGAKNVQALRDINFSVQKGEILGVVGESGCGKTTFAFSLLNLLPPDSKRSGKIFFKDRDIFSFTQRQLRDFRGSKISMVFQDPAASFNPVLPIGYQFEEVLKHKFGVKKKTDRRRVIFDSFKKVKLTHIERIMRSFPHQLSGGQLQRVALAMAVSQQPSILVADEPTSSLDVTIESQIINLFKELRDKLNLTIIFITHNLDLVKVLCDRVVVIYKGEVREINVTEQLFTFPHDSYTRELIVSFKELEK
jgi:peptide/nickel transport system ATP-binding protein